MYNPHNNSFAFRTSFLGQMTMLGLVFSVEIDIWSTWADDYVGIGI